MLMDLETSLTLVLDLSQLSILFFHREKIMASITSMEKLSVPLRIHPLFRSIDVVVMMQLSLGNIWEEDGEGWLWCNQGAGMLCFLFLIPQYDGCSCSHVNE
jgi:hypothetical protein